MVSFSKLSILLIILIVGCEVADVQPKYEHLTDIESMLVREWRYDRIEINGGIYRAATGQLEIVTNDASLRDHLIRRKIVYLDTKTYQLRWVDRGEYMLGTDGQPNWQPNFGAWRISSSEDSLFHNKGTDYEVGYKISLSEEEFTRTSVRHMSSPGPTWNAGDEVIFREVFSAEN